MFLSTRRQKELLICYYYYSVASVTFSIEISLNCYVVGGGPNGAFTVKVSDEQIKALIDYDWDSLSRGIAEKLNVSHMRIENHLQHLGYRKKLNSLNPGECELTRQFGHCHMAVLRAVRMTQ